MEHSHKRKHEIDMNNLINHPAHILNKMYWQHVYSSKLHFVEICRDIGYEDFGDF